MTLEEKIEELNAPFAHKEILEEMHKWTSLSWQQSRKEAFLQVQDMKKQLNSLSEEEAHKLMVEQTQKILKEKE